MATVKFRIKNSTKQDKNTIYVYLSNGRGNMFEVKSGFSIDPQDWNTAKGFPKQSTPENKNLNTDLKKLESFIHSSINTANSKGELIDKFWLEQKIKECFNKVDKTEAEILLNHIQYLIDNASTRMVRGKSSLGFSESTIKGYKTFLGVIKNYQKKIKKTIRLTEINNRFVDDFITWLIDSEEQGKNYAGKNIDKLKAVCNDAYRLGIPVHPYSLRIQSFKEPKKDRNIITLSFEEQNKIAETVMPTESLENIKKWILIGCTIGQRGTDLINFSIQNIRKIDDVTCIDVWQKKVDVWVTIPIFYDSIANIILNEKPYAVSIQKINDYTKKVCEIAGIDTPTKGGIMVVKEKVDKDIEKEKKKVKRKVNGVYPKWQLTTTHTFRRSFITNYDKIIPRSILMGITGHTKESHYLDYINKQVDKDDNARLFIMHLNNYKQMMQAKKENNQNDQQDN
jgi:hypothetical protein